MKNLTINWIRHGVSCGNIKTFKEFLELNFIKNIDPSLFEESIEACLYLKKYIPKNINENKLILCSELSRSIQTAILMFPEQFKKKKLKLY